MREYSKKDEQKSRVFHRQPQASEQASAEVILQAYRKCCLNNENVLGERKEELLAIQKKEKPNRTGLPDNLKLGIEGLSGYSMDDVQVFYNSDKPGQLNARAYAQGTHIHIAPGEENSLAHEAWHVVQQKQGRVRATAQMAGVRVNEEEGLEKEADRMGELAINVFPIEKKQSEVRDSKTSGVVLFDGRIHYQSLPDCNYLEVQVDLTSLFNQFLANENNEFPRDVPHEMYEYNMGGDQSATTSLNWIDRDTGEENSETFRTYNQMHSEMCALEGGLNAGVLKIDGTGRVTHDSDETVRVEDLFTEAPHCGFCSFFLGVLGIERTYPTYGRFNLAVNLNYPLPDAVKYNPVIMNRVAEMLYHQDINTFLRSILPVRDGEILTFNHPSIDSDHQIAFINLFWRSVFRTLYLFLSYVNR